MRWCVSIGAVLVAVAIAAGDVAALAAPGPKSQQADTKDNSASVDLELVIAVDVSYSMDWTNLPSSAKVASRRLERIPPGDKNRSAQQGGSDLF